MEAQLIVTKGALARRLLEWMYLASMVLPVPDSPVIKTVDVYKRQLLSFVTFWYAFSSALIKKCSLGKYVGSQYEFSTGEKPFSKKLSCSLP